MAYTRINWENTPSTATPRNATNLNKMDKGIYELTTGWISADETWEYSSVDDPTGVITISGDVTTKYSAGMRIKFTNGGNVIYGIITVVAYSAPNTLITFLHEIDPTDSLALYLMDNSAITANYYSNMKAPFGFPLNETKWSVTLINSSDVPQLAAVANTWYNLGNLNIDIPIGLWKVKTVFYGQSGLGSDTAGNRYFQSALSTSNNSVSNTMLQGGMAGYGAFVRTMMTKENIINLTSKTKYYCIARALSTSGGLNIYFVGTEVTTEVLAVCAYL